MLNWPAKKCEKVESFLRKKNLTSICFLLLCCLWGSYEKKVLEKEREKKEGDKSLTLKSGRRRLCRPLLCGMGSSESIADGTVDCTPSRRETRKGSSSRPYAFDKKVCHRPLCHRIGWEQDTNHQTWLKALSQFIPKFKHVELQGKQIEFPSLSPLLHVYMKYGLYYNAWRTWSISSQ